MEEQTDRPRVRVRERPARPTVRAHLEPGSRPSRPSWARFAAAVKAEWADSATGDSNGNITILAPARKGKTILATRGLLPIAPSRKVLLIDAKGGDKNLEGIGRVVHRMPPEPLRHFEDQPRRRVLVLRPRAREARLAVGHALMQVWREGGWTVFADELRLIMDRKYLNLGDLIERLYIFGGSRGIQIVGGTQAPRWVGTAPYDQAERHLIGRVDSKETVRKLADVIADVPDGAALLSSLDPYHFLYRGPEGVAIVSYPLRGAAERR